VLVITTLPVTINHVVKEPSHTECDVGPENGAQHVEPAIERAHDFVVRVRGEASLVRSHVGESLLESDDSVLHECK